MVKIIMAAGSFLYPSASWHHSAVTPRFLPCVRAKRGRGRTLHVSNRTKMSFLHRVLFLWSRPSVILISAAPSSCQRAWPSKGFFIVLQLNEERKSEAIKKRMNKNCLPSPERSPSISSRLTAAQEKKPSSKQQSQML